MTPVADKLNRSIVQVIIAAVDPERAIFFRLLRAWRPAKVLYEQT